MAACAALVMHVQVATRFLSCCPALYWFMAYLWVGGENTRSTDVSSSKIPAGRVIGSECS